MFTTDTPTVDLKQFTLGPHTFQGSIRTHRSVPPILRREMHRAEPVEMIKPLRWQSWTRPLIDGGQSLYRIMTQPMGQSFGQARGSRNRTR